MKISDLRLFTSGAFHCYIPKQLLDILKEDLQTVFIKNTLHLSSLDYTKKKYKSLLVNDQPNDDRFELLLRITDFVNDEIKTFQNELRSINFETEYIRSVAVDTTLTRLNESYESAIFLINNLYYFESFSILRLIFEQLVYCINICDMSDEEFKSLSKNKIKNNLSSTNLYKIKKLFPDLKLGKFYQYLSSATHIGIAEANKFVKYNEELKKVVIESRNFRLALDAAFHLLRVLDIQLIIYEYALREYLPSHLKNRSINSENYAIIFDRKIRNQSHEFNEEFKKLYYA